MRRLLTALIVLTASAAQAAEFPARQRIWVESDLTRRPIVYVALEQSLVTPLVAVKYSFQWTIDGTPGPASLSGIAECFNSRTTRYSCSALQNWFKTGQALRPQRVRDSDQQAFLMRDMEFDTEYCFRFRVEESPWTQWTCARTPPAPAPPLEPQPPIVTAELADSGKGKVGGATPNRFLVEWEGGPGERQVVYYVIEWSRKYDRWSADPSQKRYFRGEPHEGFVVLPYEAAESPDTYYLFRVCAQNIGGRTCSAASRTLGAAVIKGQAESNRAPGGAADGFSRPAGVKPTARVLPGGSAAGRAPIPICDAARAAAERGSPATPGLEKQCGGLLRATAMSPASAQTDALATRGEAIAEESVWFSALRALQREGAMRRGFDIGMAAAQGQTEWGPGKQRTLDALSPAEQEGFRVAMSVIFDVNRYAERARIGLAITEADATLAEARALETDPRYWLGFDIATAIFGDPAQGAQGNTATGPGSLGIRDSLSAPARRGFNAAVQVHLGRQY